MTDLSNVYVGDDIVILRGNKIITIVKVERITKTLIISGSYRFNKKTGEFPKSDQDFLTKVERLAKMRGCIPDLDYGQPRAALATDEDKQRFFEMQRGK